MIRQNRRSGKASARCAGDRSDLPAQGQRRDGKYYAITVPGKQNGVQPRSIGFSPIPGTTAPDDYSTLYIDIERTLTVLNVLFPVRGGKLFRQRARWSEEKFAEYFDKVADIALTALGQDQVRLGRLALTGLQNEIVSREAARVKNAYIRRLGSWALAFIVPTATFYLICRYSASDTVIHKFREFLSLLAGCFLGTWLSFSIRRQQLTFWDLPRLEEDLLDPPIRLIFVAGLTILVGLMFTTRMIVFNIGGFNTGFLESGTLAVLIGALCGIGEVGLSGTVARRASDFMAAVGTGHPPGSSAASTPQGGGTAGEAPTGT
jgi:hypothetical protein